MVQTLSTRDNKPFPNNALPILYYPEAVKQLVNAKKSAYSVKGFLEMNGYSNGWVGGIFSYHHFHSNTHEVLACISGKAEVQLGGPGAKVCSFKKGDVLLLPAGVAHKLIEATNDFQIVGAYPDGKEPDMQKGNVDAYDEIITRISQVAKPTFDPVQKTQGAVFDYWK